MYLYTFSICVDNYLLSSLSVHHLTAPQKLYGPWVRVKMCLAKLIPSSGTGFYEHLNQKPRNLKPDTLSALKLL